MEVNNYLNKFKLVLEKVVEGNIVINNYYTEKLLNLLEDVTHNNPVKLLLHTPCFSDVIFEYVKNIKTVTTSVKFRKMEKYGFQALSVKSHILSNFTSNIPPALHLAYIKLATVHLSHYSGVNSLLKHRVWEHILCQNIHQKSAKVSNAAYNFISKLAWKLNECNKETEMLDVLNFVVSPIKASAYINIQDIDDEIDKRSKDKVYTYLKALLAILSETANVLAENKIVSALKRQYFIEPDLYKILITTRCSSVVHVINNTMMRLYVSDASLSFLLSGKIDDFCNMVVAYHHNYIAHLFTKRSLAFIIDYVIQSNVIWSCIEKELRLKNVQFPLTFQRNDQKLDLRNQFIVHLTVPLAGYTNSDNTALTEQMTAKMGKILTEHIYSSCYSLWMFLLGNDSKQMVIQTIREFSRLKGNMTSAQAGILFQSLYYVLEMFKLSDGAGGLILSENPLKTPDDVKLLYLLLNAISMLLKEYKISWYEHVEIVTLQAGLTNLLKQNILQTTQLVQVLDLIELCVKKFLSPNMTLLVESKQDSTLTEIGAIMKTYIQHEDWEVRDSALNLLLSCTNISFIKYMPLQKVINENELMICATKAAMTDPEFYVQSSALKCLAAATKIENIWRKVMAQNPQIYLQIFYIVRNCPEGMVRKEAVNLLTQISTNQKLSQSLKNTIYEIMVSAAINDLHWEVQLEALTFWNHAIQSQLTYRGMLDGKFPAVTFSKEKRKIVSLNDKEIVKALTCIMNDLSSVGCFTVLLECMNEDYNIEVMERAYSMATRLISILDDYKFQTIPDNYITHSKIDEDIEIEEEALDLSIHVTNEEGRGKVIDNVLNSDLTDLIIELHDRLNNLTLNDTTQNIRPTRRENIHGNKFIKIFKNTDYLSIIKDKKEWNADVCSLNALLDEILNL